MTKVQLIKMLEKFDDNIEIKIHVVMEYGMGCISGDKDGDICIGDDDGDEIDCDGNLVLTVNGNEEFESGWGE